MIEKRLSIRRLPAAMIIVIGCLVASIGDGREDSQTVEQSRTDLEKALTDALAQIDLQPAAIGVKPWEKESTLLGSYPRIKRYFDQPLLLVKETRELTFAMTEARKSPREILDAAAAWLPRDAAKFQPTAHQETLSNALVELCAAKPDALKKETLEQIDKMPPALQQGIAILAGAFARACRLRAGTLAGLTEKEIESLKVLSAALFNDEISVKTAKPGTREPLDRLTKKADLAKLISAGLELADAVERSAPLLKKGAAELKEKNEILLECATPAGLVRVGGTADNRYKEAAALAIDLGGNDAYAGPEGSSNNSPQGVSLCLDLAGDDTYTTKTDYAFGAALLGCGMLIDLQGNDLYESSNRSQGFCIGGLGLLLDEDGTDRYQAGAASQGTALWGLGLLIDRAGNDAYLAGNTSQGHGAPDGLGILLDITGDDRYACGDFSHGVGVGRRSFDQSPNSFYGGIGMVLDRSGNDLHAAGSPGGQGPAQSLSSAYFYGIGIVFDVEGDDSFVVKNRVYSVGSAAHYGLALLLDAAGNDIYSSGDIGYAYDFSVSLVIDCKGDDRYNGGRIFNVGQTKNATKSIFVDLKGTDRYAVKSMSWGGAESLIVFVDMEGTDDYALPPEVKWGNGRKDTAKRTRVRIDR